ncbi:serine hydrolase domain-containing protein [Dokdonella sp.]|uniref:serine hydrolase domain-containing protein n=1 Tax=Dokdonella sp. TaxID=2291710 RepID=UPI001B178A10|nr:serine hydrolase domain-containing protein [Dokdonella sp.]MBO9663762.1 beta-lactamase family protein [Dokdonella sp.]
MKRAVWILAGFALGVATAHARDTAFYDRAFEQTMARYHLPGLAVGVIEDGKVVYLRTGGETVAGSGRKITPRTLFKIASNSKAMTAATLARLVEAGKLAWDDPVVKHLPTFRMHDEWVGRNMTVRDLLIHNSGLPEGAGDLMLWPEPNAFTRADIVAGLSHLKPKYGFRAGYAYDNLLYVVAGEVAAAAGGASYEELVRREVFAPLGLGCRVGEWKREAADDLAQPHMRKDGRNVVLNGDDAMVPAITSAAAGGIRCSLEDMLAWARNWLVPDEKQRQWLPDAQRRALWTAYTPMPISERRRTRDRTHFFAYGLGFRLADVDGEWSVSHTGTLSGMYSMMSLLPDRRSGFVLMINGDGGAARGVLGEVLLKHFTAPQRKLGVAALADEQAREAAAKPAARRLPDTSARVAATPDSMRARLGVWRDAWFGRVSLCAADGGVRFAAEKSPRMTGKVMRVGARELVQWDDAGVDPEAWLDFPYAQSMTMAKVDPDGDFSSDYEDLAFVREGDCAGEGR